MKLTFQVLLALRAIGNLGMTSDWKVLSKCMRNDKIPISVRVSAVQAMRKVRCESKGWDVSAQHLCLSVKFKNLNLARVRNW